MICKIKKIFQKKILKNLPIAKKVLPLQTEIRIVLWCNGNTTDFGSVIHSSNLCRTTMRYSNLT